MTRKPARLLVLGIGLCLLLGAGASVVLWLNPAFGNGADWHEFSALIDVLALALWMLLFAFYWMRHQDD